MNKNHSCFSGVAGVFVSVTALTFASIADTMKTATPEVNTFAAPFLKKTYAGMYTYSGTFAPNKSVLGTWAWAVYPAPNNPQEVDARINAWLHPKNGKAPDKIDKPKEVIQLLDGGKVARSKFSGGYFWSGDRLIGVNDDQALKMEVRTVDGRDFLLVERGGFDTVPDGDEVKVVPKDFHCGDHVYVREKQERVLYGGGSTSVLPRESNMNDQP